MVRLCVPAGKPELLVPSAMGMHVANGMQAMTSMPSLGDHVSASLPQSLL